jgi:alkylhydroperoxidase family enzyme
VSFHGTALRAEGWVDEQIQGARDFDPQQAGLSPKEGVLFNFAMKANGDPHSTDKGDVDLLRDHGVTDMEIAELLEIVALGNSFNLFCDTLDIGPDPFLDYGVGHRT